MGWVLIGFGALLAAMNTAILVESTLRRKHISMVPLLGGIALLAGAAMLGWRWGMLIAFADPSTISLLMLPPYLLVRAIRRS
jgi:hypothetical protein